MFSFNWKYNDFEIRSSDPINKTGFPYIELVKWREENNRKHCFTLALYNWDDEGGALQFIGNRPFLEIAEIDIQPIWKQLWLACEMLKDYYEKERHN